MKDSDPISKYGLSNDSTIAMIKINEAPQGGIPNLGGLGGLGGMPGMNPGQIGQLMNNPQYQQTMNALLNNPQVLNQVLNSPQIRPLLEQNPQLRQVLQDPQARQLLFNPQLLQRMGQLGGLGQGGANPFAGGLGGLNDLNNINVTQNPNTRLGDLFSQWMERERSGGNTGSGSSQPQSQPQQPIFGGQQPRPQPTFQQFPQPDPNVDYKEKYKDQIAQIKDMGIDDEEKIIEALKKCDGNVQYALNRLFG